MQKIARLISFVPVFLLALGWFGVIHPALDSIAVFRQPLIALTALSLPFLYSTWKPMLVVGLILVFSSWWSLDPTRWKKGSLPEQKIVVYQKNLMAIIEDYDQIIDDILEQDADFVMLQEVVFARLSELDRLNDHFKDHRFCSTDKYGVAIYSKHKLEDGGYKCAIWYGYVVAKTNIEDRPIWIMAQHLRWPWPYKQPERVAKIKRRLPKFDAPVIIAGDFNHVAWSNSVKDYSEHFDVRRLGRAWKTFSLVPYLLGLPIDHILVSKELDGQTEARPFLGSDHRGVVARIGFVD